MISNSCSSIPNVKGHNVAKITACNQAVGNEMAKEMLELRATFRNQNDMVGRDLKDHLVPTPVGSM